MGIYSEKFANAKPLFCFWRLFSKKNFECGTFERGSVELRIMFKYGNTDCNQISLNFSYLKRVYTIF